MVYVISGLIACICVIIWLSVVCIIMARKEKEYTDKICALEERYTKLKENAWKMNVFEKPLETETISASVVVRDRDILPRFDIRHDPNKEHACNTLAINIAKELIDRRCIAFRVELNPAVLESTVTGSVRVVKGD